MLDQSVRQAWGTNLRAAREERGLTQTQLAAAVGVTQVTIWRWETGAVAPADEYKVRLVHVLDTDVADLFPLS